MGKPFPACLLTYVPRLVEHPERWMHSGRKQPWRELGAMVADIALVDPYDAYQKLDDARAASP